LQIFLTCSIIKY